MNVLGSPLHPSSMNTGTPTETTNTSLPDSLPPAPLVVTHSFVSPPSHPQDTGVVPRSYHERGSPQNDYTTRPSRWVSSQIVHKIKTFYKMYQKGDKKKNKQGNILLFDLAASLFKTKQKKFFFIKHLSVFKSYFTSNLSICQLLFFSFVHFPVRLFLLRDSQSNPKAFVLTLCHHQKIKHFQILPVSKAKQQTPDKNYSIATRKCQPFYIVAKKVNK